MDKKTLLRFFGIAFTVALMFGFLALPALGSDLADPHGNVQCSKIVESFQTVINLIGVAGGIVFFVMMLVGGAMLMLSAGNPEAAQRAQQTLIWGVIGTIIALGLVFLTSTLAEDILGASTADIFDLQKWICEGF